MQSGRSAFRRWRAVQPIEVAVHLGTGRGTATLVHGIEAESVVMTTCGIFLICLYSGTCVVEIISLKWDRGNSTMRVEETKNGSQ